MTLTRPPGGADTFLSMLWFSMLSIRCVPVYKDASSLPCVQEAHEEVEAIIRIDTFEQSQPWLFASIKQLTTQLLPQLKHYQEYLTHALQLLVVKLCDLDDLYNQASVAAVRFFINGADTESEVTAWLQGESLDLQLCVNPKQHAIRRQHELHKSPAQITTGIFYSIPGVVIDMYITPCVLCSTGNSGRQCKLQYYRGCYCCLAGG